MSDRVPDYEDHDMEMTPRLPSAPGEGTTSGPKKMAISSCALPKYLPLDEALEDAVFLRALAAAIDPEGFDALRPEPLSEEEVEVIVERIAQKIVRSGEEVREEVISFSGTTRDVQGSSYRYPQRIKTPRRKSRYLQKSPRPHEV
jgi:hypothetical protein